mgnify:CR=1 FL=1
MVTYLLNWNPKRWDWLELEDEIAVLQEQGWLEARWSCGVTKSIMTGDRFFLIRLGRPPKGIMGSGWIKSSPFRDLHWDDGLAAEGRRALFVDIVFDSLLNADFDQILDLDFLQNDSVLRQMNWLTQASGVHIPDQVADELQRQWSSFLMVEAMPHEIDEQGTTEGAAKIVTLTTYERSLAARQRCVQHYGAQCAVCGFDFSKVYGIVGEGYIHVHHVIPLSTIGSEYKVDPIRDLIPVCPNCHAMIHKRTPCYSIDEMRAMIEVQLR